jgi:hypothetical protein
MDVLPFPSLRPSRATMVNVLPSAKHPFMSWPFAISHRLFAEEGLSPRLWQVPDHGLDLAPPEWESVRPVSGGWSAAGPVPGDLLP